MERVALQLLAHKRQLHRNLRLRLAQHLRKQLHRQRLQPVERQDQVHHAELAVPLILGPRAERRADTVRDDVGELRVAHPALELRADAGVAARRGAGLHEAVHPLGRRGLRGVGVVLGVEGGVDVLELGPASRGEVADVSIRVLLPPSGGE